MKFKIRSHKKGFTTDFNCTACGHKFRRELRRIYVDSPTFLQHKIHKQKTRHSEYIIPQRIACPKCLAVDQYELTEYTLARLSMAMSAALMWGGLVARHPVMIIDFAMSDGQVIHPLDALEQCRAEVTAGPQDQPARLRFANVLRTLGYFDEAKEEFTTLVGQNPAQLEAWYNLAAIHVAQGHKREAKKVLQHLVEQAQQMSDLNSGEVIMAQNAHNYLDGSCPLDELTPRSLFETVLPPSSHQPRVRLKRHKG